ncbi:MAG: hypothetical protein R3C26_26050 [Calditrichia bacterium]
MFTVAPSGKIKLATSLETPRLSSRHSIVTGSVAPLELVLMPPAAPDEYRA